MIEEQTGGVAVVQQQMEPPPRREYSPAPAGHFPEELALTAPSGLMSWDDVRVRYDYYKNRGYLRDLDMQVRAIRIHLTNMIRYLLDLIIITGLCKVGGVVVQIPRVAEAGTVL